MKMKKVVKEKNLYKKQIEKFEKKEKNEEKRVESKIISKIRELGSSVKNNI